MDSFDTFFLIISIIFPILFITVFIIIVYSIIKAVINASKVQSEINKQVVDSIKDEPVTITYPARCPSCGAPNPDNQAKCKYCDRAF